jgi:glycosyltransferase involved in cell wall biosynthesis
LNSEVLYPPVDTKFFSSSNHKQHGTIVSVCRLHPKKKSEQMINLFRKLKGDYRFTLAGALSDKFKKYGRQLMAIAAQDPRVSILFNPTDSEIKNLYGKATIFWYTYTKEEFGLPVAEAMSCGAPAVALRGGGVNEIIVNNQTGFLANSEDDFLEKTNLLLNNDSFCRQMGAAARRRVKENFSTQVFTEKIRSVIVRAIAREHANVRG